MTAIFSQGEATRTNRSNSDRPEAAPSPFRPAMRANADAGTKTRARAIFLIGHRVEGVNTKAGSQGKGSARDAESESERQRIEGAVIAGLRSPCEPLKKLAPLSFSETLGRIVNGTDDELDAADVALQVARSVGGQRMVRHRTFAGPKWETKGETRMRVWSYGPRPRITSIPVVWLLPAASAKPAQPDRVSVVTRPLTERAKVLAKGSCIGSGQSQAPGWRTRTQTLAARGGVPWSAKADHVGKGWLLGVFGCGALLRPSA